ncbi:MAG TPA: CoA transferase [Dehalococcoidia bacterium]|nr:CoA transferase [Dehalococcoidia bacterium]
MPALEGIRVIDLTQYEAGTSCTETLAFLGADVIKVESPKGGEPGRRLLSDNPDADAPYFILLNASKRGVTIDLKTEKGRQILTDLIREGDVIVENFAPGGLEKLGFTWETIREINPRIIYATVKGFGTYGPRADFLSFDPIAQAAGGGISTTGYLDGAPQKPGPTVGDTGTGIHAALGILGAIIQRETTGRGQKVEVSMQDAVLNITRVGLREYYDTGKPPRRRGNGVTASGPTWLYPCAPGGPNDYVYIYPSNDEMWEALLGVIGREDLRGDERFRGRAGRGRQGQVIDELISTWTRTQTKYQAMDKAAQAGIPAGAVLDTQEMLTNEQVLAREMMVTIDHPQRGKVTITGCPIKLSDSPPVIGPAPLLGQHNAEVFAEVFGWTGEDIERLRADGVI